jgi:hypothetical protein
VSALDASKYYLFLTWTNENPKNLGDNDEIIRNVKSFSTLELLEMIDKGEINETYVSNALQMAIRRINK